MDDYKEVLLGREYLNRFFDCYASQLREAFDAIGLGGDPIDQFKSKQDALENDTYVWCVSEHAENDYEYGRLSMWRGFGHAIRAALILKLPLQDTTSGLGLSFRPVSYVGYEQFQEEMAEVIEKIRLRSNELLQRCRPEELRDELFYMFTTAVVTVKHRGFQEEREWRAIYWPTFTKQSRVTKAVECIQGIPQLVCKIPLENYPNEDPDLQVQGVTIPEMVSKIIIGPSVYHGPMRRAFIDILKDAGVPEPETRVFSSDIPLRT
jgi:hypothetical protein